MRVTPDIPDTLTRFEDARIRSIIAQMAQYGMAVPGSVPTSDAVADALRMKHKDFMDIVLRRTTVDGTHIYASMSTGGDVAAPRAVLSKRDMWRR